MAQISGRVGGVYAEELILDDGEAAWDSTDAAVSVTADSSIYKVGTKSAKMECTDDLPATTLAAEQEITPVNLTNYEVLQCWLYSTLVLAADDWQFHLDTDTGMSDADVTLSIPILAASAWTRVCWDLGDTTGMTSIDWIGVYQKTNKLAMDLYVDNVSVLKLIDGIKSWTLDYTVDTLDITDFIDGGSTPFGRTFVPGLSSWSGSFEGFKDGAPLALGFASEVLLILGESETTGQTWMGDAVITGIHPSVAIDGVVTYSYDFQGSGELTEAAL